MAGGRSLAIVPLRRQRKCCSIDYDGIGLSQAPVVSAAGAVRRWICEAVTR